MNLCLICFVCLLLFFNPQLKVILSSAQYIIKATILDKWCITTYQQHYIFLCGGILKIPPNFYSFLILVERITFSSCQNASLFRKTFSDTLLLWSSLHFTLAADNSSGLMSNIPTELIVCNKSCIFLCTGFGSDGVSSPIASFVVPWFVVVAGRVLITQPVFWLMMSCAHTAPRLCFSNMPCPQQ